MNTTYLINCIAGNVFKSEVSSPLPDAMYLGLSTTSPNKNGGGVTEPAKSYGYERIIITGKLTSPANGVVSNISALSFPESTDNWGTLTHYVIYDSLSDGHLLMYGELPVSHAVSKDTIMQIPAQELKLAVI